MEALNPLIDNSFFAYFSQKEKYEDVFLQEIKENFPSNYRVFEARYLSFSERGKGQLIVLIEHKNEICLNLAKEGALSEEKTATLFEELLSEKKKLLCEVQSEKELAHQEKIKKIVSLLVTKRGTINNYVIDSLKPLLNESVKRDQIIANILALLKESKPFREKVEEQKKSQDIIKIKELIHFFFAKPLEAPTNACDIVSFYLAALMTHLRQEPVGSCFATHLAIEQLRDHPFETLNDLISIGNTNRLKRVIGLVTQEFPITRLIHDKVLEKTVSIDKEGRLSCGESLFLSRGIHAIQQVFHVSKEELIASLCSLSICNRDPKKPFKVEHLMQSFGTVLSQKYPYLKNTTSLIKLCFVSQTTHPLIKLWENGIADMAEAEEEGVIKSSLLQATFAAMKTHFPQSEEETMAHIESSLMKNTRYRFDPTLCHQMKQESSGAFVLFDCSLRRSIDWKRLDSREKFLFYLKRECNKKHLKTIIDSDSFCHTLIDTFNPQNSKHLRTLRFEKILCAPWISYSGNDPLRVRSIFTEEKKIESIRLLPKHPRDLYERLLPLIRNFKEGKELSSLHVLGVHSFSLLLRHPTQKRKILQKKQKLLKHMKERIISKKKMNVIRNDLHEIKKQHCCFPPLHKEHVTYKFFIEHMHETIDSLSFSKETKRHLWEQFEISLIKNLPKSLKKKLSKRLFHFADSNFSSDLLEVHFAFGPNLFKKGLSLYQVNEDGTNPTLMSKNKWISNKSWIVLLESSD